MNDARCMMSRFAEGHVRLSHKGGSSNEVWGVDDITSEVAFVTSDSRTFQGAAPPNATRD